MRLASHRLPAPLLGSLLARGIRRRATLFVIGLHESLPEPVPELVPWAGARATYERVARPEEAGE